MFCLECGLPVDPAPFDVHKARRKRAGLTERFRRSWETLFANNKFRRKSR